MHPFILFIILIITYIYYFLIIFILTIFLNTMYSCELIYVGILSEHDCLY